MAGEEPSRSAIPAVPKFDGDPGAPDDGQKSDNAMPPPPPRASAPPPPKFAAPPPLSRSAADPARAAAAAAARAAQHVTPAQRERAVMEAAAAAIAARDSPSSDAPAAPRAPPGPYEPPEWSGIPETIPYTLEIMKNGAILSTIDLRAMCIDAGRGHLTLGRSPDVSDILLDHPSSSRLHAVLQFRGSDGAPFLYDPGSTHGIWVNKKRAPTGQFLPLRVGDQLRFGESSRTHVLCGPAELMEEEGPNREARHQAATLEALCRRKAADAAAAEAAMARAISGSAAGGRGASWGMGDDGDDGDADLDPDSLDDLDWKVYAASKGLSDKQQKIADKIRKRESRIEHLQREADKIMAKTRGGMEEMTAGQAATLSRNEGEVARAEEEIEELEEQLLESIRDALGQKKRKAAGGGGGGGHKRRRPVAGSDEDEDDGGSDEDSFYDRTARGEKSGGAARRRRGGGAGGAAVQEVEDAASLYGKLEALKEEKAKKAAALAAEIAKSGAAAPAPTPAPAAAGDDSLDAFMQQVDASLDNDRVAVARREVDDVQAALARTERLLKIADPDGLYKPGTKAAEAAVLRAKKALEVEALRKEAEARQRQEAAAARAAEAAALAAAAVPEEEEEEKEEAERKVAPKKAAELANMHRLGASEEGGSGDGEAATGGLQFGGPEPQQHAPRRRGPIGPSLPPDAAAAAKPPSPPGEREVSGYEARRAGIEAALRAQQQEKTSEDPGVRGATVEEGEEGEDVAGWRPPEGQTGDGRTSLNDRLGY